MVATARLRPVSRPRARIAAETPGVANVVFVHRACALGLATRLGRQSGSMECERTGKVVWVALMLAATGQFRTLVTVLSDTGERYVSTGMWKR